MWKIKAIIGWILDTISRIKYLKFNKKNDPYIYPPD